MRIRDAEGVMKAEERADILNDINEMLWEKGYRYVVCGYDDREEADMFIVILQKDGSYHE